MFSMRNLERCNYELVTLIVIAILTIHKCKGQTDRIIIPLYSN